MLCALLAFGVGALHAAAPPVLGVVHVEGFTLRDVLDTTRPLMQRRAALVQFEHDADAGDPFAQYALGSLYHAGERLPQALLAHDSAKARLYLSNAAVQGSLRAMKKMAEIELEDKHGLEAMVWAQLAGYYALQYRKLIEPGTVEAKLGAAQGWGERYTADLIHRVLVVTGERVMPQVIEDEKLFIAAHDATVRHGLALSLADERAAPVRTGSPFYRFANDADREGATGRAMIADFLLIVDRHGRSRELWLLDAVPDFDLGASRAMAWSAHSLAFDVDPKAFSSDEDLLAFLETIVHVSGEYSLHDAK